MRNAVVAVVLAGCATQGPGDTGAIGPMTNGVSTLAGSSRPGDVDGNRDTARFADPVNTARGPDGKTYVADFDNSKIRVVDDAGNVSTLIAQNNFRRPFGIAFAPDGSLYVSTDNDSLGGHTLMSGSIWKVDIAAKTATVIANAIGRPRGFTPMADGRIAITDDLHHVVEILTPSTGNLMTIAGTWDQPGMVDASGPAARFSTPYSVVVRKDGTLVVADFDNNRLRLVGLDGSVATLAGAGTAGFADGAGAAAELHHPQALAIDHNDTIYITDLGNYRIRRMKGDTVDTIAGDGTGGWLDADNPLDAELYGLEGMSVNAEGTMLYVADGTRGEVVPHNYVRTVKVVP